MKKSKPLIITILMLVLMISSYAAINAEYGSKEDPLVSLSYIKEVLVPSTIDNIDAVVEEKTSAYLGDLDQKVKDFSNNFSDNAQVAGFVSSVASEYAKMENTTQVVNLSSGQTININSGTEFLVRSGTAMVLSNGIINTTAGQNATANTTALANNLYLAVENSQQITATSDTKILIFGSYTQN